MKLLPRQHKNGQLRLQTQTRPTKRLPIQQFIAFVNNSFFSYKIDLLGDNNEQMT